MNHVLTEQLIYEILSVVEEIPEGCVASYGQIARLIGRENNARLVGAVTLPSGNTKSAGSRQPPLKNSTDRPKSKAC